MKHKTSISPAITAFIVILALAAHQSATGGGAKPSAEKIPSSKHPTPGAAMKAYPSRYYVIHTSLGIETVREASLRMTVVAREYHRRTRSFAGVIRKKMPFYIFSDRAQYKAGGGPKGSAGAFTGSKLMALADNKTRRHLWHVVQHEAFHQFAHYVITPRLPIWANEGMAEYFGLGEWTGDDFVTGVIPPARLKRLKGLINGNELAPFKEMLTMTAAQWNRQSNLRNYDQAWSMVHFLVHGNGGKYKGAFSAYINDIARGRTSVQAFEARFGKFDSSTIKAFEQRYRKWWLDQPDRGTTQLYVEALMKTLTSFLARAHASGMEFGTAEEYFNAAGNGEIKIDIAKRPHLWLPQSLLEKSLKQADNIEKWSLRTDTPAPRLVLTLENGVEFTGGFRLRPGNRPIVAVSPGKSEKAKNRSKNRK